MSYSTSVATVCATFFRRSNMSPVMRDSTSRARPWWSRSRADDGRTAGS